MRKANVVIVGASGVGKSTLASYLTSSTSPAVSDSIDSVYANPVFATGSPLDGAVCAGLTINAVDMPGLLDSGRRPNREVVDESLRFMLACGVAEVNAVVLVCGNSPRFDRSVEEVLACCLSSFSERLWAHLVVAINRVPEPPPASSGGFAATTGEREVADGEWEAKVAAWRREFARLEAAHSKVPHELAEARVAGVPFFRLSPRLSPPRDFAALGVASFYDAARVCGPRTVAELGALAAHIGTTLCTLEPLRTADLLARSAAAAPGGRRKGAAYELAEARGRATDAAQRARGELRLADEVRRRAREFWECDPGGPDAARLEAQAARHVEAALAAQEECERLQCEADEVADRAMTNPQGQAIEAAMAVVAGAAAMFCFYCCCSSVSQSHVECG